MLHLLHKWLCLGLVLLLVGAPALAASVGVKANTATRFYKSASTQSASVPLAKGTSLTMTASSGSWAKVTYKGVTGYVPLKHLDSRTRYGAYVNRNTYVYASASTSAARKAVKVNTKVYVIGKSGNYARVQNASGTLTCYIPSQYLSTGKVTVASGAAASAASWKSKVVKLNWFEGGSDVLKNGAYGYIYDINTGTVVHIKRMGGRYHADCEPASASDTAKLKKIAGGKFSWDAHAVILYAGGKYVACAINTMPHGSQTLTNNGFDGQFCLHMTGSRTHETNSENATHQAAVNAAYRWAH